jgi:hypothetical protein
VSALLNQRPHFRFDLLGKFAVQLLGFQQVHLEVQLAGLKVVA